MTAANSTVTSMDGALQPAPPFKSAVAAVHIVFVFTGVITTILGPVLPALTARWGLNDSQAGAFFTAQFLGSMTGVVVSSFLVARYGPRRCMALGSGLMALGIGAMSFAPWLMALTCTYSYGIGLGLTIPAANLFVAEVNPTRRGSALNLLNFAWGMGAIACPWLVGWVGYRGLSAFFLALALAIGVTSPVLLAANWPEIPASRSAAASAAKLVGNRTAVARLAALFFLYVGTETTLSGWLATYAERMQTGMARVAVLMPSFFWAALLLGRGLAPAVLRKVEEARLSRAGLALGGAGVTVVLLAPSIAVAAAGAVVAGLGFAVVFPLLVSAVTHRFGSSAPRVTSLMFVMAGLGGASLPWLAGFASTRFGALRAGMSIPLAADIVMLALASAAFVQREDTTAVKMAARVT